LHRSSQDYSLYINYDKRILVLVYVDDLVLAAAEMEDIGWIKACLTREFEMTDLGELETFHRLQIKRERSKGLLTVGQQKYIERVLHRHGMEDSRPSLTPLDLNLRLSGHTRNEASVSADQDISIERYQSPVGLLMYAMLGNPTRPGICCRIS